MCSAEASTRFNGETFPRKHIEYGQRPEAAAIRQLIGQNVKTSGIIRPSHPHRLAYRHDGLASPEQAWRPCQPFFPIEAIDQFPPTDQPSRFSNTAILR